jgi:peptide/nickel transport system permease protein
VAFRLAYIVDDPVLMYVGADASAAIVESYHVALGFGRRLMDFIRMLDIPVVAAGLRSVAIVLVLLNLLADILYTVLDPRVTHR